MKTVLKTDGDFSSELERHILEAAHINLIEGNAKTSRDVIELGLKCQPEALMVLQAPISGEVFECLPTVRIVSRYGIGVDMIDLAAANKYNVAVAYVPDYCVDEVASHTIALMLNVWRRVGLFHARLQSGVWAIDPARPVYRLSGRTIGMIGFGRLAQEVCRKLSTWNVNLVAFDPHAEDAVFRRHQIRRAASLEALLTESDIVSLHAPLTTETKHMIDGQALRLMKPEAILVNTARGALIDENALVHALQSQEISGVGLDVVEREPLSPTSALWLMDNVIVTPHVAYYSEESLKIVRQQTAQAVVDGLGGVRPVHLANPESWNGRRR